MRAPVILVVDDEPDVESLITQRFRRKIREGELEFVFTRDGQHALDVLAEMPEIDIVLSDINMPRMDGLTLLSRLGEIRSDLRAVVVSAYGDMANIRTAMNRGAFDFVTKPIEFDDLEITIGRTLDNLADYRELERRRTEAELARAMLARYFSPKVAETLSQGGTSLKPRGEKREASFLFTDLADFTALVESSEPDVIVELLNAYIDGMAQVVFSHDGTVMKVIGDAVQAIFGAPIAQEDHAARAVACALDMDVFAESFRNEWRARGLELGATRIGVNAGDAIVGDFGGEAYFDYSAYGDAVNTAARLEAANKVLGTRICVSRAVAERIDDFAGRPAGALHLPGLSEPIEAFEPLNREAGSNGFHDDYRAAYEKLAAGDPEATPQLAALLATRPTDPLVQFHLRRSLAGASDVLVDLSRK